ncbi:MAG TPA: tRNA (pseudouridine(54)-N(1))-methyltransferase TrmY [archaeon]|nr:tRNA (pseudouridine(54)-N(1))-methyltransferase TrmY [archaeon]
MRTFILYSHARTDASWNIEDMPSSGGRMDLVARCVSASLWLSYTIRRDTEFIAVLNGAPSPPIAMKFSGERLKNVSPDERSVGLWLKKVLAQNVEKDWIEIFPGIFAAQKSFQEIVKEYKEQKIFILHEKGEPIQEQKFSKEENLVFILGDNVGIPAKDEKFALRHGEKISLGKTSYVASACINVVNWIADTSSHSE